MQTISCIIALIFCLYLTSCKKDFSHDDYINAKSVGLFLENHLVAERPFLKVKAAALGQDLMFYGTFIPMLKSPSGHSLKGRIVKFEKFADRIVLLESPKGHSISGNQSTILLAEFPIVSDDSDGFVIDFAKGMNNVFITRNVHAGSFSDKNIDNAEQFKAIGLHASFIKSIDIDFNTMVITQIAQWKTPKSDLISAEFRYYFRDYAPSPDFKKKSLGFSRHGQYFSTPPQINAPTTEAQHYITKWNIKKPIIFYISDNTPKLYRDAIKDGLIFWNHIFNKEIIMVKNLEASLSAPHPRLNIIQWVPWDNEASAYADMIVDHLSGEIVQAQVYVRSGWVFGSARKLRFELQKLLINNGTDIPSTDQSAPLPSIFDNHNDCQFLDAPEALFELANGVGTMHVQSLKIITADILRTVIAHEIGHVLGLRHNMASSTAGTMSIKERNDALESYLSSGKLDLDHNKYLSRSIMDVFSAADDALIGAQMRVLLQEDPKKLREIYLWDTEAINYGYFDKAMSSNTPFCTDDDLKSYLDCRRWDYSNTPMLFAADKLNNTPAHVAMIMAETFMNALDPARKGGPLAIRDIPLNSASVLKAIQVHIVDLFSWFSQDARSIQIEAHFGAAGTHNRDAIAKARFVSVREQITKEGLEQTLFALLPPFRKAELEPSYLVNIFKNQLGTILQQAGITLSQKQWEEAQNIAQDFFTIFSNEILLVFASTLSRMRFDDPDFQSPLEDALFAIAKELILQKDEKAQPTFRYNKKIREAAALMLNPGVGLVNDWSMHNIQALSQELINLMRKHAGVYGNEITNILSLPRPTRQWLLEQNAILNALNRAKALQRPAGEIIPYK